MDDDSEKNKAKETKKYVIKKRLKLNDYEDCLLNTNIIVQSKQRFKSNFIMYILNKHLVKLQHINFDDYANENKIEHILRWPYI